VTLPLDTLITGWTAQWTKDPQAVMDYAVDWSLWMASGDYLVACAFIPSSADITIVSQTIGDTLDGISDANAVAWIGGGVQGNTYTVTCHVTSANGRQDDRTFSLLIENL
jgi:hypothetical protein